MSNRILSDGDIKEGKEKENENQQLDGESYPKPVRSNRTVESHHPLVTDDASKVTSQESENFRKHHQSTNHDRRFDEKSATTRSLPVVQQTPRSEQRSNHRHLNPISQSSEEIKRSRSSTHISSSLKIVTAEKLLEEHRKRRNKTSPISKSSSGSDLPKTTNSTLRTKPIATDLRLILIHPNEIQVLEEVGRGNFGTVYRGLLKGTRDIALKCLHSEDGNFYRGSFDDIDPDVSELLHEANIMTKLRHPNLSRIVGITFFGDEQKLSLVTDFMKNGSLLNYLRKHKNIFLKSDHRLISKKLNHFARQIFDAMFYLEERGIIHRDLAARNCLIGDEDILKVGDFGLTTLTEYGLYKGTNRTICATRWASPEAIFSSKYSSRSDVWSFGITLWELYSLGERPFRILSNGRVRDVLKNPSENLSQYLPKPRPFASEETYTHMILLCLTHNVTMRPRFKDLRERVFTILNG